MASDPLSRLLCLLSLLFCLPLAVAEDGFLLSNEWLLAHAADQDLILVDARDAQAYEQGHIAGAINLPVDLTYDRNHPERVAGVKVIKALFSQAGIGNDAHLLIYDDGSFKHAARLFWVFEVFGMERVSLLNAGYAQWSAAGLPISTEPTQRAPVDFVPIMQHERIATAFTTRLAALTGSTILIDARVEPEYSGRESMTGRYGHIPTARNYPSQLNLVPDVDRPGIHDIEALEAVYRDLGKDRPVIAYCNYGKESALTYFALRRLGYDVSTYDGSWVDWSSQHALPVNNPSAGEDQLRSLMAR